MSDTDRQGRSIDKNFKCMKTEHNDDGTYTVTIDGVEYKMEDSYELAHFFEDLGI